MESTRRSSRSICSSVARCQAARVWRRVRSRDGPAAQRRLVGEQIGVGADDRERRAQLVGDQRDELAARLVDGLEGLDPGLGLGLLAALLDDPGQQVGDRSELGDVGLAEVARLLGLDVEDAHDLVVPGQRHRQHRGDEPALVDPADPQEARVGLDVRDDQRPPVGRHAAGDALAERDAPGRSGTGRGRWWRRGSGTLRRDRAGRARRRRRGAHRASGRRPSRAARPRSAPWSPGGRPRAGSGAARAGQRRSQAASGASGGARAGPLASGPGPGVGSQLAGGGRILLKAKRRHGTQDKAYGRLPIRTVAARWRLGRGTVEAGRSRDPTATVSRGRRRAARDRDGRGPRPARGRGPPARRPARPGHRRSRPARAVRPRRTDPAADHRPAPRRRPGWTGPGSTATCTIWTSGRPRRSSARSGSTSRWSTWPRPRAGAGPPPARAPLATAFSTIRSPTRSSAFAGSIERRPRSKPRRGDSRSSPVLTAHPTEARRRTVLVALPRCGTLLERLDDPRLTPSQDRDVRRRLREEINSCLRTSHLKPCRPDAARRSACTGMAFFDATPAHAGAAPASSSSTERRTLRLGGRWPRLSDTRPEWTRPPLIGPFPPLGQLDRRRPRRQSPGDRRDHREDPAHPGRSRPARLRGRRHAPDADESRGPRRIGSPGRSRRASPATPKTCPRPIEIASAASCPDELLPAALSGSSPSGCAGPGLRFTGAAGTAERSATLSRQTLPVELVEIQEALVADGLGRGVTLRVCRDALAPWNVPGFHLASLEIRQH